MKKPKCKLTPVPVGMEIMPWHWWLTPELSMTEAEREYYYGHPLAGTVLNVAGRLYEVNIPHG
jgi:hypothetical protein